MVTKPDQSSTNAADPELHPVLPEVFLKTPGTPQCRIAVGVSGGADSVALLRCLLNILRPESGSLHIAHLNHKLRGKTSAADANWVAKFADANRCPCTIEAICVASAAAESGLGIEESARNLRYDFLTRTAAAQNCPYVAVAHNRDDQVETILHHFIRGSGLAGLRGMPPSRPLGNGIQLIRPLIGSTRGEIVAYLRAIEQPWRQDESNVDDTYTRNRLRQELLPMLETRFNRNVGSSIAQLGQQAVEIQEAIDWMTSRAVADSVLDRTPSVIRLSIPPLLDLPRHVVRECFVHVWKLQNWPRQAMGYEHWNRLAEMINRPDRITFPGIIDVHSRDAMIICRRHKSPPPAPAPGIFPEFPCLCTTPPEGNFGPGSENPARSAKTQEPPR